VIAETVVWTNDTTRATALTKQNGVLVKTGTLTKRYIGTFRTTSTIGQCEDSISQRYVWNYYNRISRTLQVIEATNTWTYATATWRVWNNSAANRVSFVRGVNEDSVSLIFLCGVSSSTGSALIGISLGGGAPVALFSRSAITLANELVAFYNGLPAEGFNYLQLMEYASAATTTFYGDNSASIAQQSGAYGELEA